jgi:hypothetical protein
MRENCFPVLAAALMLGSCVANLSTPVVENSSIWGRVDCQRGEGNPAIQAEFEEAKALCLSRGESAAAGAGTAGNNSCMSEHGYILRTKSEHLAACEATPAEKRRDLRRNALAPNPHRHQRQSRRLRPLNNDLVRANDFYYFLEWKAELLAI